MNAKENIAAAIAHETPVRSPEQDRFWGSDAIAQTLHALDIPYIALNPGASYRGLHDSLVNYLGNRAPQMVLCLHDETAVSLAHGYFKASGRMIASALHSNVGLMHATMQIFNAWCDRASILIVGATGPWDAAKRRPWIEWIHTASDQGALVRNFTKWDNQPGSVTAAVEALLRAAQITQTAPRGPVYVNLDAGIQEQKIDAMPPVPDVARYAAPMPAAPAADLVAEAARLLSDARNPMILAGRCSRSIEDWNARIALAEKLNARVFTHMKLGASFPTDHRLSAAPPATRLLPETCKLMAEADVILSLDWLDLAGTFKQVYGTRPVTAKVIQVSCDAHSHRGWSMDYQALPPTDVYLMCDPDGAVPALLNAVKARPAAPAAVVQQPAAAASNTLNIASLAQALRSAIRGIDVSFTRFPHGWNGAYMHFRHPLDYIGYDGGGGLGSGLGITVGAALALKGSGRIPIGLLGDGDFLQGNTAVWTAVHYKIPCLVIVCNNRSFFNDERHQGRVAATRGRPEENAWIGQRLSEPDIDIAGMARAQGALAIGPVTRVEEVQPAIEKGIATVQAGGVCVIDMRVAPGYDAE
jgi:thiamine pyrophosphate-dependent acetolactate synthase large subunit-like protein